MVLIEDGLDLAQRTDGDNELKRSMPYIDPIPFARQQRQAPTDSEQLLWQFLRNRQRRGQKFRRQHPIGIYTADFFCIAAELDVELDGTPHESPEGQQKDQARDAWMHKQGIAVLRIPSMQVDSDLQQVLKQIDQALDQCCQQKNAKIKNK